MIAFTAITLDDRYINNLELLKESWDRVGYEFKYDLLLMPNQEVPKLPIEPNRVHVIDCIESNNRTKYLSYMQSARFGLAYNFVGEEVVLVTDGDILPISKSHFKLSDGYDRIMHLNAKEYFTQMGVRYPACYYVMKARLWNKYLNPNNLGINEWLKRYIEVPCYGYDEFLMMNKLSGIPLDRKVIGHNLRVTLVNYKIAIKFRNSNNDIVDFHFHSMSDTDKVREIYNKLIGDN